MYISAAWVSICLFIVRVFSGPKVTDGQRQGYPAFLFVWFENRLNQVRHRVSGGQKEKQKYNKMKKSIKFGMAMLAMLALAGCGSKKQTVETYQAPKGTVSPGLEMVMPCAVESKSDANYFRELGVGNDADKQQARLKAITGANRMLNQRLGGVVKGISEDYVKNVTGEKVNMMQSELEGRLLKVVDNVLNDADNACEKLFLTEAGTWESYYVIEVSKQVLVDKMAEAMAQDEASQIEFNRDKFRDSAQKLMNEVK